MRQLVVAALGAALFLSSPTIAGDQPPVPTVAPVVRVLDVSKVDK